ncbi:TPA: hypothetical protein ACH3X2_004234 [Trebouxia sp. C0005]
MQFAVGMVQVRAIQQYQTANTLCFDQTMLKSKGAGATLSLTAGQSRRPLQVPHLVRRLTSRAPELQNRDQCTHGHAHKIVCSACKGYAYGINIPSDSTPQQQSSQLDKGPNISLLADELQKQWHGKLNMHLGNILIRPGSERKVWWSCDQCPDGFQHIWEAAIMRRTQGSGCPFCSGTAICQHNTLARKAPEVALFWDAKKNHPLTPDQVTVFSHMRAHWKCSACLHEWQAAVRHKTRAMSGCPKCAKAHAGRKADGTRQRHPTFAGAKHALLQQWDHDRNRENGNFPNNTTLRSNKLIWWCCHACPKGKVHSWQARAFSQTSGSMLSGCPCCVGLKLCECNSLETVCPDIAADFDVEENGVSAAEVTSSTHTKYSWLSDEPGAKKRSVNRRTWHTRRKSITDARRS